MHPLDNAFHSKENKSDKKLLQDEGYEIYSGGGLLLIETANTYGTINTGLSVRKASPPVIAGGVELFDFYLA